MSESLVQKTAKFLLVDNLSCEREIEKRGREMRELSTVYTYRKYEREKERERWSSLFNKVKIIKKKKK